MEAPGLLHPSLQSYPPMEHIPTCHNPHLSLLLYNPYACPCSSDSRTLRHCVAWPLLPSQPPCYCHPFPAPLFSGPNLSGSFLPQALCTDDPHNPALAHGFSPHILGEASFLWQPSLTVESGPCYHLGGAAPSLH